MKLVKKMLSLNKSKTKNVPISSQLFKLDGKMASYKNSKNFVEKLQKLNLKKDVSVQS